MFQTASTSYKLLTLSISVLFFTLGSPESKSTTMAQPAIDQTNHAIACFASRFCNEVKSNKNMVSSPLSVEIVLGMLTLGSSGKSHEELIGVLGVPNDDGIREGFKAVTSKLQSLKGVTLNMANKIYLKEGSYQLAPKFQKDADEVFAAAVEKLDFGAAGANEIINKWVEQKTNNRIKDLLTADSVNTNTQLVLVNAIYFKGTWQNQFNPKETEMLPFYTSPNNSVDVPMMHKKTNFAYTESQKLDAKILKIPYQGFDASMIVVLPNEVTGLQNVLNKLSSGTNLLEEIKRLHSQDVDVLLPKFRVETEIDLIPVLQKMGVNQIFDPQNNDVTGLLDSSEPLYCSKAIQKAFIEINEEGAEAAAATGAVMMLRCARITQPQVFKADRPFFFAILSDQTVVFEGEYRGPQ